MAPRTTATPFWARRPAARRAPLPGNGNIARPKAAIERDPAAPDDAGTWLRRRSSSALLDFDAPGRASEVPPLSLAPPLSETPGPWERQIELADEALAAAEFEHALELLDGVHPSPVHSPRLAVRALVVESWARMQLGETHSALELLERARTISEQVHCSDTDRAEVFFRLGCCRFSLGAASNAASLLTLALDLCDHTSAPCDRLRVQILDWRSRCYQRQHDWEAARADVERALELVQDIGDDAATGLIYLQASIVAERESQWLLARCYAEQARDLLAGEGNELTLAKVLNNLGGIHFLLGDTERAVDCLHRAAELATAQGSDLYTGYALSSLAQVHLRSGEPGEAETESRRALELLGDRADHLNELGNAQLILARALLAQGRLFEAETTCAGAEETFRLFGSTSHTANAWLARGDIARSTGDLDRAADLYRDAAEALQLVHF